MNRNTHEMLSRLERAGISPEDALALRRISMTLRRWHELECGDGNGHIERDEETGRPRYHNDLARYLDPHDPRAWRVIPDRERGAKKRLAAILRRYGGRFTGYIQGDPRGAALWILRPGDVPAGETPDSHYTRGIAVYR